MRTNRTERRRIHFRVEPLHVNLGIDFGTSYTKVCYRNLGREQSGILTFGGEPYLRSIVLVDEYHRLSTPISNDARGSQETFLKMRIGDSKYRYGQESMYVQALSSYYLAEIIRGAMGEFRRQETELAAGRQIIWSANIGVPVDYYDSPKIDLFKEVFAIAWMWAVSNGVPTTVRDAIGKYQIGQRKVDLTATDCRAVPEIVAAVWSFVTSRAARPGIYTYFDVGGGTLDGVCFKYENNEGDRRIRCYSGKVASLGVSSLTRRTGDVNIERVLTAYKLPPPDVYKQLAKYEDEIQTLVGEIIITGKKKTGGFKGNFLVDSMDLLPIFLGGGGASSAWYQKAIENTYGTRQHDRAGVPAYALKTVPIPSDLEMYGLADNNVFPRFTVAYGLSVPAGEAPEVSLPSASYPIPPSQKPNDIPPFETHKDLYE